MGDGIISSGFPRAIAEKYPGAIIDMFCTKTHAGALRGNPFIRNFYYFKTYSPPFRIVRQEKIIDSFLCQLRQLLCARKNKYDIVADTASYFHKSNMRMIKFLNKTKRAAVVGVYTDELKKRYRKDFLDTIYTNLCEKGVWEFFGTDKNAKYEIFIPKEKKEKATAYFSAYKKDKNKKIIIFNGDGSGKKSLSASKIASTVKTILNSDKNLLIFFLGYKPALKKYREAAEKIGGERVFITYETDVTDTMALVSAADLLVSVDTALIHMASATGTKTVEIYSQNMPGYIPLFPKFVEFKTVKQSGNLDRFEMDAFSEEEVAAATKELLYP